MNFTVKDCACGCRHRIESGEFASDEHLWRDGCHCNGFIAPAKADRYKILRAKHEAKLGTPEEQARIAAEMERIRRERELLEPLDKMLDRIGAPPRKLPRVSKSKRGAGRG